MRATGQLKSYVPATASKPSVPFIGLIGDNV